MRWRAIHPGCFDATLIWISSLVASTNRVSNAKSSWGAFFRRAFSPMSRRIVIIQGHPDAHEARFVRVLADAYAKSAVKAEHDVKVAEHDVKQVFRPGFAIEKVEGGKTWKKRLVGKSARIVVTMGMPAFIYRGISAPMA